MFFMISFLYKKTYLSYAFLLIILFIYFFIKSISCRSYLHYNSIHI